MVLRQNHTSVSFRFPSSKTPTFSPQFQEVIQGQRMERRRGFHRFILANADRK